MPGIDEVINDKTKLLGTDYRLKLATTLANQIDTRDPLAYRVAFPVVVLEGRVFRCIALFVKKDNPRYVAIAEHNKHVYAQPNSVAQWLFMFLGYENEGRWRRQSEDLIKLFPEQPDLPEFEIT